MKIGILTWHYYPNFGSSLQAFALQESIKKLGHTVFIINYRNPLINTVSVKDKSRILLSRLLGRIFPRFRYAHLNYMRTFFNQTRPVYNGVDVIKLTEDFETIVYGSDQIWAPNVYNPIYQGKYSPNCKKVSYAASIGLPEIPHNLVDEYKENLSRFSYIGVREEEGKKILKKQCGINSKVVLDPTLLLSVERYISMERDALIKGPFVFCYFLNATHQYKYCVEAYAKSRGLRVVGCSAKSEDVEWMTIVKNISACEFLWLIHHASFVFTDSYHGTIFSLLYHKCFRTFMRFSEDDPIVQNSRIRQLDQLFCISPLIQNTDQLVADISFDFDKFERSLSQQREESLAFLKKALNEE